MPLPVDAELGPIPSKSRRPIDGYHASYDEPDRSNAIALRRAKELANLFSCDTPFGWPVNWSGEYAFIYLPLDSGDLQVDKTTPPRAVPRPEAIKMFLVNDVSQRFHHLGDVPGELQQAVDPSATVGDRHSACLM